MWSTHRWFILFVAVLAGSTSLSSADDRTEIRKAVGKYVAAFNRGDAEAVAALWHEKGEWVSPGGDRIQGRDAILREMKAYFAEGGAHIAIEDPRIRLLSSTVAVEEGRATVTRVGELPAESTYIAIHVKDGDEWKLESVRETALPQPPSNFEHLKDLEWMVGTWLDQDDVAKITTSCRWTKNRNFLLRTFSVEVAGKLELEGTQVIGYDAARSQIRSWIFDTAGGFADGTWHRDGNRWIVKSAQTLRDGRRASAMNIITYIDEDTLSWQSTGREIDGELQASIDPVVVKRVRSGRNSTAQRDAAFASEALVNEK